jgi:hypothetical protein
MGSAMQAPLDANSGVATTGELHAHERPALLPHNEHRCGPPSTVEECQQGGWAAFNHPFPFVNQGSCIAYVHQRKRITLLVPEDPIQ